jgi:hypothetical protein
MLGQAASAARHRVAAARTGLRDLIEDLPGPGCDPAQAGADLFPMPLRVLLIRRPLFEEVPLDIDERIQPLDIAGQLRDLSGELDVIDHLKVANEMARDSLLWAP